MENKVMTNRVRPNPSGACGVTMCFSGDRSVSHNTSADQETTERDTGGRSDVRKLQLIGTWNSADVADVPAPSINTFKTSVMVANISMKSPCATFVFAPRERLMLADPGRRAERIQQAVMPPTICAADTTGGESAGCVCVTQQVEQGGDL
jgi:hypothetical protein